MYVLLNAILLLILAMVIFRVGKRHVLRCKTANNSPLSALPSYYGWCTVLWCIPPVILLYLVWLGTGTEQISIPPYVVLVILGLIALIGALFLSKAIFTPTFHARKHVEKIAKATLFTAAVISISITIMIIGSVLFESVLFFRQIPLTEFLFGTNWSPQTALRADQAGGSGSFGAVPVFIGTLLITLIAMVVATPLGLLSAIYLSEYASKRTRAIVKPALELLAGIPTVVYGYFAAITLAPLLKNIGLTLGLDVASESALAAGLVMGVMIIPFILSLSDDVMNAVPVSLHDASLALGATRAETVKRVIIPAALPGIMGAVLLAISRAIGETMIVVMAAGLAANLSFNPLDSVTTVTAQIVTLLVGDQEFDSPKTLSAFALGLTLFVLTLILNVASLMIVKKYREQYD